jgi:hypothetical protein
MKVKTELNYKIKDPSGSEQMQKVYKEQSWKFLQKVEELENHIAKRLSVRCLSSRFLQRDLAGKIIRKTPLEGKTFKLINRGDSYVLEGELQGVDESVLRFLGRWEDYRFLLPSGEIRLGQRWELEADELVLLFLGKENSIIKGKIFCRLDKIYSDKVIISLRLSSSARRKFSEELELTLRGKMCFNIDKGMLEYINFKGVMKLKKAVIIKERSYQIEMDAKDLLMSMRFEKR